MIWVAPHCLAGAPAKVKRPGVDARGIPGVRYGVYQVTTAECPPGYIAYRRLPHFSCKHCMAQDYDKCPLSFAGSFTLQKVAK